MSLVEDSELCRTAEDGEPCRTVEDSELCRTAESISLFNGPEVKAGGLRLEWANVGIEGIEKRI